MRRDATIWRVVFLTPPLALYGLVVVWPLLSSFFYAFTDWNGFDPNYAFIGLDNFAKITTDPLFYGAVINTAIWMAAAIVIPAGLGLALALLLDQGLAGSSVFKSIFYLPICLAAVVVGQIWIWIFQPDWGLLNEFVMPTPGKGEAPVAWLADPDTALGSVIVAWSWQQTGLAMVIFLAGLTGISSDHLEAAALDGATGWRRTWHIVLPLLKPATVVVIALSVINALKGFDILYIMTGGGPFHSSDTLAMFMYTESFKKYRMGYGSAIAVVLFLITLVIIALYFRQLKRLDDIFD